MFRGQGSGAVLVGILGGKESLIQDGKKKLLLDQEEMAASVYYGRLALLGHKAMPVCPMLHMGEIGRHLLGRRGVGKKDLCLISNLL